MIISKLSSHVSCDPTLVLPLLTTNGFLVTCVYIYKPVVPMGLSNWPRLRLGSR